MDIIIEHWKQEDIPHINRLIEAAFNEFVAPTLLKNGIKTFFRDVNEAELRRNYTRYEGYTARFNGSIVGFIAADANCHIAFLFVSGDYHNCGIARMLVGHIERWCSGRSLSKVSTYASLNAVETYEWLGFVKNNGEQEINGLRFQPMTKHLRR